jgi:hypothetical protein
MIEPVGSVEAGKLDCKVMLELNTCPFSKAPIKSRPPGVNNPERVLFLLINIIADIPLSL